jgi:hypothetical protein
MRRDLPALSRSAACFVRGENIPGRYRDRASFSEQEKSAQMSGYFRTLVLRTFYQRWSVNRELNARLHQMASPSKLCILTITKHIAHCLFGDFLM